MIFISKIISNLDAEKSGFYENPNFGGPHLTSKWKLNGQSIFRRSYFEYHYIFGLHKRLALHSCYVKFFRTFYYSMYICAYFGSENFTCKWSMLFRGSKNFIETVLFIIHVCDFNIKNIQITNWASGISWMKKTPFEKPVTRMWVTELKSAAVSVGLMYLSRATSLSSSPLTFLSSFVGIASIK